MAKRQALMNRNKQRQEVVDRYAELRRKLKKEGDYVALQRLPRDASPTRVVNRCLLTGRPRAVYRKFKISRNMLRDLALEGRIPGMKKASW
jgi:small subunit ribosomal protein S14